MVVFSFQCGINTLQVFDTSHKTSKDKTLSLSLIVVGLDLVVHLTFIRSGHRGGDGALCSLTNFSTSLRFACSALAPGLTGDAKCLPVDL